MGYINVVTVSCSWLWCCWCVIHSSGGHPHIAQAVLSDSSNHNTFCKYFGCINYVASHESTRFLKHVAIIGIVKDHSALFVTDLSLFFTHFQYINTCVFVYFRATSPSKSDLHMVVPTSLLVMVTSCLPHHAKLQTSLYQKPKTKPQNLNYHFCKTTV